MSRRQQRGVVLVLAALLSAVFIGMAALVVGLGVLATNKARAQIIANAAALAALEKWVNPGSVNLTTTQKVELVRSRAEEILTLNQSLSNLLDPTMGLGKIYVQGQDAGNDRAGTLKLGVFYSRNPEEDTDSPEDSPPGPCLNASHYPCLAYYPSTIPNNATVNAMQLSIDAGAANPILAPFGAIFGKTMFQVHVESTATLVERCTAFLLDISPSVYSDTHDSLFREYRTPTVAPPPGETAPAVVVVDPAQPVPGVYGFRRDNVQGEGTDWHCETFNDVWDDDETKRTERIGWCATRPDRQTNPTPYPFSDDDLVLDYPTAGQNFSYPLAVVPSDPAYPTFHYRDDYAERLSIALDIPVYLDTYLYPGYYDGPQPFASYLLGINTALRTLESQQTPFDLVQVKVFTGLIVDEVPPPLNPPASPSPYPKLWNDLGYMIQLSDYYSIGPCVQEAPPPADPVCKTQEQPNFITHGWFSLFTVDAENDDNTTNLVEVLDYTIEDLVASCPSNSKKQILLFSDGISSCKYTTHTNEVRTPNTNTRVCGSDYDIYKNAVKQLIGVPAAPENPNGVTYPTILERLKESEIALTAIVNGDYAEPNFKNIVRDPADANASSIYLTYLEAQAHGFSGLGTGTCDSPYSDDGCDFFVSAPTCPGQPCTTQLAYENLSKQGYTFRHANGVIGKMAIETGGLWCPLMPLMPESEAGPNGCPSPHYDVNGQLSDLCRQDGKTQAYSILNLSKAETAAQCAAQAVGSNPFLLYEPEYTCEITLGESC